MKRATKKVSLVMELADWHWIVTQAEENFATPSYIIRLIIKRAKGDEERIHGN